MIRMSQQRSVER